MKTSLLTLLGCFFFSLANAQQQLPISDPEIHEFDFWLGEWDVYKFGTDTIVGYSSITSVVDSVGLEENYHTPANRGAYKGTSLNKYNFAKAQWEQYYIDNSGVTLHLVGGIKDGKMVLGNQQQTAQGNIFNRITWTPMEDGSVRQTWHARANDKEEWGVLFDGHYKSKK